MEIVVQRVGLHQSDRACTDGVAGELLLDRRGDEVADVAAGQFGQMQPQTMCKFERDARIQRRRVRACPRLVHGRPQV